MLYTQFIVASLENNHEKYIKYSHFPYVTTHNPDCVSFLPYSYTICDLMDT